MKSAAIIGCGKPPQSYSGHKVGWGIAYNHADGYVKSFPDITLYAVDPNPENLKAFADKYKIPQANCFASTDALYAAVVPDAVSICTWPAMHVPQAIDAAKRGVKAIAVEKPVGLDAFEIQNLIDTAKQHKSRVAVGHQRRYEPNFTKAAELLKSCVLGEKLVLEARVGDDWDMLSWSVHWFDMANYLFDALPKSIMAGVDHTGQRRYGHAVENASVVFVDYSANRQAVFITGPAAIPNFGITIRGEKGMMVIGVKIQLWTTAGYQEIDCTDANFPGAFALLLADLWNSVQGTDSRCDISKCAPATLMAYAAHESARTQKRIDWPLLTWFAPLEILQHPPMSAIQQKLKVALISDAHHGWDWAGPDMTAQHGLLRALQALGHDVTMLDAREDLPATALDGQDLLVLFHTQRTTRPSHRAVIEPWFKSGKPVLISHCGIGAYADWPEFRKWIGRYWVWGNESTSPSKHPHVPCIIKVDDASRFTTAWKEAWLPIDEMYQNLGGDVRINVLATAIGPDGYAQPYAWQVVDHPNVVAWLPGHRQDMFTLDTVCDGLKACIRLATQSR